MLLLSVGNTLFVHRDYDISFKGFANVIKIDEPISNKYPNDILLNVAIVGKNVFANTKYASKTILKYLEQNGYSIHHVSQGYAHCSTCIVNDNAIITADKGEGVSSHKRRASVVSACNKYDGKSRRKRRGATARSRNVAKKYKQNVAPITLMPKRTHITQPPCSQASSNVIVVALIAKKVIVITQSSFQESA
jgi:ferredoxin